MSSEVSTEQVRTETFLCPAPADLDLRVDRGRIEVRATDVQHVRAEVSLDEPHPSDRALRALEEVEIEYSEPSRRLVVKTPRGLRRVRLAVSVEAPERSRLAVRVHLGSLTVSGLLSGLDAAAGSGDIRAADIDGDVDVRTGSGEARVGRVTGRFRSRTGSGNLEVAALAGGEARLATGSGAVRLGVVQNDVTVRTGSGSITVAQAGEGRLNLATGSGDVRVAIRPGVAAELDLVSGSGRARSELEVSDQPPADAPAVTVRARTGSGDVVVTRATEGGTA